MSKKPKPRGDDAAESSNSGRARNELHDLLLEMLYGSYEQSGTDFTEDITRIYKTVRKVIEKYGLGHLTGVSNTEIKNALQAARATRAQGVGDIVAKINALNQLNLDQLRSHQLTQFPRLPELIHYIRTRAHVPGQKGLGYHVGHITDAEIKRAYLTFWLAHHAEIDALEGSMSFVDILINSVAAIVQGMIAAAAPPPPPPPLVPPVHVVPGWFGPPGHGTEATDPVFGQWREDGYVSDNESDAERMARHMRMSDVD